MGKVSVTETECWAGGLGVPGGAQAKKKITMSAVGGGQENPGDGGRRGRPRLPQALQSQRGLRVFVRGSEEAGMAFIQETEQLTLVSALPPAPW